MGFFSSFFFISSAGVVFKGIILMWMEEAFTVVIFFMFLIFLSEVSAEVSVSIFVDFKTVSEMLIIFFFLGVIVVVAADFSFGKLVTVGGFSIFGCFFVGPMLVLTAAVGIVAEVKGMILVCLMFFIFSVLSTAVIFFKGYGFGLRVKIFFFFGLGAAEEDEAVIFFLIFVFGQESSSQDKKIRLY